MMKSLLILLLAALAAVSVQSFAVHTPVWAPAVQVRVLKRTWMAVMMVGPIAGVGC